MGEEFGVGEHHARAEVDLEELSTEPRVREVDLGASDIGAPALLHDGDVGRPGAQCVGQWKGHMGLRAHATVRVEGEDRQLGHGM